LLVRGEKLLQDAKAENRGAGEMPLGDKAKTIKPPHYLPGTSFRKRRNRVDTSVIKHNKATLPQTSENFKVLLTKIKSYLFT